MAAGGREMWWKTLAAYLVAFGALQWGVYRYGKAMEAVRAPVRRDHPDND